MSRHTASNSASIAGDDHSPAWGGLWKRPVASSTARSVDERAGAIHHRR